MLDIVRKYRDAAAWIVIALVVGSMVLAVVRFVFMAMTDNTIGQAALSYSETTVGLPAALLILGVVCICVFVKPTSSMAAIVTLTGAIVVSTGALLTLVFMFIGLTATLGGAFGIMLQILGSLADVLLKALVAAALWVLYRAQRSGKVGSPMAANTPSVQSPAPAVPGNVPPETPAGSAWTTAADAARGVPNQQRPAAGAPRQWRPVQRPTEGNNLNR